MTINVVWKPYPGSQELFLRCPVFEVLLEGTRGGGKTDCLLMDFAKEVGHGLGSAWTGALFRQTYPQLDDVVKKSKRWFPQIFPKAKFNESDYVWKWPTGEELKFRYGQTEDDYWNYHGHEFCVEEHTLVQTPSGAVPINSLAPGDAVKTLDGTQIIERVFPPKEKECVRIYVFDADLNLISSQVQSEDHRLLSIDEKHCSELSGSSRTRGTSPASTLTWLSSKSLRGERPERRESGACSAGARSFGTESQQKRREVLRLLPLCDCVIDFLLAQGPDESRLPESTRCFVLGRLLERLSDSEARSPVTLEGLVQLCEQCLLSRPESVFRGVSSARAATQAIRDFLDGCHPSCRSCGALFQTAEECARALAQRLGGAGGLVPVLLHRDDEGKSRTNSRPFDVAVFPHPYSGRPLSMGRKTSLGFVLIGSKLKARTIDVCVSTSNHYITESGLANKNCWLGFEELTNWPDLSFYQSMMSTCRSSIEGTPKRVRSTCNPFGKGHEAVKEYFRIGELPACTIIEPDRPFITGPDGRKLDLSYRKRCRITSSIWENRTLLENDPSYLASILAIKDVNRRKAWLNGDWSIHVGAFLEGVWDPAVHVIDPFFIPSSWPKWRAMDWGFSAPYAVLWLAMDPDGCIYVWRELYGKGEKPGSGSRETVDQVASRMDAIEVHDQRNGYEYQYSIADSAIFSNVGTDRSIGKAFRDAGYKWYPAWKGKGSRINGAQEIIRLLAAGKLKFFKTCKESIRTIPALHPSEINPEDVDTTEEDHAWDALRYGVIRKRQAPEDEE